MLEWLDTLSAIATGWALGVAVSRLHMQAQLKMCLQAIAERLDAMNSSLRRTTLRAVP